MQTDTALEISPKFYYVNATLFGTDNVLARGPDSAMNYVESKMINASGKMAKLLGTDIFLDGTGVNSATVNLDGFQQALDNGGTYAAYGGITRSDLGVANSTNNQGINGYVASLNPFTMTGLQSAYGAAWFGNEHVDLIVTTQSVWDMIWNKIQPQQRFLEESSDVAKIGFQSIRWNAASITVDQYCPSGYIFGLNTRYIQFWISTLPKYQFGSNQWALLVSDLQANGGKFGESCDANPEPSRTQVRACVETRRHPLQSIGDEGIVRTNGKRTVGETVTGFKEALNSSGSPIADKDLPLAA